MRQLLPCLFPISLIAQQAPNYATQLVNPFIGTGGHGHTFPGACVPNGLVQLSPDTRPDGTFDWDGCGGYHYSDSLIYGFSHTHLSGTGVADLCDVLLMPMSDKYSTRPEDYRSHFSHATEVAHAGYYKVRLSDENTDVELTATRHCGVHRYTMPAGKEQFVLLDLRHRDQLLRSSIEQVGATELVGQRRSSSWAKDQHLFFCMQFSRPIALVPAPSDSSKAVIGVKADAAPLIIKVGISAVSIEGARANLQAEVPGWDFDAVRKQAEDAWNEKLGKIQVEGGTKEQQRIFYTALYHSYVAPYIFNDVDGKYRGMDGQVHHADHNVYTVFSLWDTFRALHPLMTILEPEMTSDWIKTFLLHYKDGGRLPVWELWGNETDCMIGYHSVSVITDAFAKGIRDFDTDLALEAMLASANRDEPGLNAYRNKGFISSEDQSESVSKTLEYAYDDWCIARFAHALQRNDTKRDFNRRARNWRNLFDPATHFFRARRNGGLAPAFDPYEVNFNYTEANAWQYSLFVPQDPHGLDHAHEQGGGSLETFLDTLFTTRSTTTGRDQVDMTGLIGQYVHGNEPSHHMAYLLEPEKMRPMLKRIMDEQYRDAPDGSIGNEDCGQMSAWYVMSALGIYQVCPGDPTYTLGHPQFSSASIAVGDGKRFTINVADSTWKEFSDAAWGSRMDKEKALKKDRIAAEQWEAPPAPNDELVSLPTIGHSAIVEGGVLQFDRDRVRKPEPVTKHEEEEEESHGTAFMPIISAAGSTFTDSLLVSVFSFQPKTLRVLMDQGNGSAAVPNASEFWIHQTCVIEASLNGQLPVSARFTKIDSDLNIKLGTPYANQYAAGGDNALIDGLRGGRDFRTGEWQGTEGQDVLATIDLGKVKKLKRVGLGTLQDQASWIFYPELIEVAWSTTGRTWSSTVAKHSVKRDADGSMIMDLFTGPINKKAQFVKIRVQNGGVCPNWHRGKGGASWLFLDEVLIETEQGIGGR